MFFNKKLKGQLIKSSKNLIYQHTKIIYTHDRKKKTTTKNSHGVTTVQIQTACTPQRPPGVTHRSTQETNPRTAKL